MPQRLEQFATFFGLAISALLPLVNPLGSALVFVSLVGEVPAAVYRSLARKIAINTVLFFLVIQILGTAVLKFFGISLPVVQVAGGLAIAAMGWGLLTGHEAPAKQEVKELDDHAIGSLQNKTFYPFTFPLTAGPGSLVVTITLSAHTPAKGFFVDFAAHAGIMAAVLVLSLGVYFCYGYAPAITARISKQTAEGITRVIAFVLLCIGVQIMWNGIALLLKSLLHS
ncbi:MAG TPA: MarC family protein [Terracidiphilus sp.]